MSMIAGAPVISPPPASARRPSWSVMIPTYNCAGYLRRTLESVLRQDPGPELMQIEVVDDCSTRDDPEAVVNELGRGRVQFYRQPQNVGAITNFNTCIQRSTGQLVHILHGDDLVADGFYEQLGAPLLQNDDLGAACCRQTYITESGQPLLTTRPELPRPGVWAEALDVLAVSNRIQPPALVVKRAVYEQLGGFNPSLFHSADWEMLVRLAAHTGIFYHSEPLARYRVHTASDTSRLLQTGANMQDARRCIQIFSDYLPAHRAAGLARRAYGYLVLVGLRRAGQAAIKGRAGIAAIQLREAAICAGQALFPARASQP